VAKPLPPEVKRSATLTLTASSPAVVSVACLGESVLESAEPVASASAPVTINAAQPNDFVVSAKWEAATTPQALRCVLSDADGVLLDQTFWGVETIEETLSPPAK
jgi:hypothetical protein